MSLHGPIPAASRVVAGEEARHDTEPDPVPLPRWTLAEHAPALRWRRGVPGLHVEHGTETARGWPYPASLWCADTDETRSPAWWRERLGPVGFRITWFEHGPDGQPADGVVLGEWGPVDRVPEAAVVLREVAPEWVAVQTQDGRRVVRVYRLPVECGGLPLYLLTAARLRYLVTGEKP